MDVLSDKKGCDEMWVAFGCGVFVGAMIGIVVMSLCIVSSNADYDDDDYGNF